MVTDSIIMQLFLSYLSLTSYQAGLVFVPNYVLQIIKVGLEAPPTMH